MKSRSQKAADLVLAGKASQAEAARRFGITRSAVSMFLLAKGIRTGHTELGRHACRARSPEARARIRLAIQAAAVKYRKERRIPDTEIILAFLARGKTFAQAAARYGLTRNQVAGYVYRAKKEKGICGSSDGLSGQEDAMAARSGQREPARRKALEGAEA